MGNSSSTTTHFLITRKKIRCTNATLFKFDNCKQYFIFNFPYFELPKLRYIRAFAFCFRAIYMVSTYLRKKYSSYHIINVIFHFFFQWTYYTANSWGTCSDGKGGVGCGAQETFRACSGTYIHQSTQQPI